MAKRNEAGSVFVLAAFAALIVLLSAQVRPAVAADGGYTTVIAGIVNGVVANARGVAPGLVRLVFHDCFVRGCDGSVLLDNTPENTSSTATANNPLAGKTEKASPSNGGLRGLEVITTIRSELAKNNIIVSCADAVVFAAREATNVLSNGNILYDIDGPGRQDGVISSAEDPGKFLPAPTATFAQLLEKFEAKGFNTTELVALSGAHSIGVTHLSSFQDRLDPTLSTTARNEINPKYQKVIIAEAAQPGNQTNAFKNNIRDMGDAAVKSSGYSASRAIMKAVNVFDNSYYIANTQNMVRFKSDWVLRTDPAAEALLQKYKANATLWKDDFKAAMTKLSSLKVLDSEVPRWENGTRLSCSATNQQFYP